MSKQTGTGQPHIYPEQIGTIPIHNYTLNKVYKFNTIVASLFGRIGNSKKQNIELIKISKLILSKMSKAESFKLKKHYEATR